MRKLVRAMAGSVMVALLGSGLGASANDSVADAARPDYGRRGFFVGVGGGADLFPAASEAWGFGKLFVGYRASRHFAFDLDLQVGSEGNSTIISFVPEARVYLIGDRRVQPYLLAGLGLWTTTDRGSNVLGILRPGLGLDIYVTENIVLTPLLQYSFLFNSRDITTFSGITVAGTVQFRF
jgi:hypothetical protein